MARLHRSLYAQVLPGDPAWRHLRCPLAGKRAAMKPLGDGFIKLIKMLIAPIVFATITGRDRADGRHEGRRTHRASARSSYFEVVSTLALLIGLVVVNVLQPGAGLHVDAGAADAAAAGYGSRRADNAPLSSC